ncbi:MAG: hypothetical protein KGN34_10510 [Sphingomonadales bacterium]|nr:hypothetical protein [Sphingomonadales bacterium]
MAGFGLVTVSGLQRDRDPAVQWEDPFGNDYAATGGNDFPPGGVHLNKFMAKSFDRRHDDASALLQTAANWSAKNGTSVIVDGPLHLAQAALIDSPGARLHFNYADIRVHETVPWSSTRFGRSFAIGIHVVADDVRIQGHCRMIGTGVPGRTFLQGLYADQVDNLMIGSFTLGNLAIGQHFMCCNNLVCEETWAFSMWGLQGDRANPNGAGSAQAISGCTQSHFGPLTSLYNDKPARYLSVGRDASGSSRDNRHNHYGFVTASVRPGSPWAQVTGVRSSVDSIFAGGSGKNMSFLLNIEKYATDDAYHVDNNDFGDWTGTILKMPQSSVCCGMNVWIDRGAKGVGRNRVGIISASLPPLDPNFFQKKGVFLPQTFGLWCNSGDWSIGRLAFKGFTFGVLAESCSLDIGQLDLTSPEYAGLRIGNAVRGKLGLLRLRSDLALAPPEIPLIDTKLCSNGLPASSLTIDVAELPGRGSGLRPLTGNGSSSICQVVVRRQG